MKTVRSAALYLTVLILLCAPAASAGSDGPFVLPPEEQAEAAYQRYRALCEENGFDLLPDEEADLEYADDMYIMMRLPVDVAEWGLVYNAFMPGPPPMPGDAFVGYSLCVHKDTPAFDRVDELMAMALIALFDMSPKAAQARVHGALEDMGSNDSEGGIGYVIADSVRLIVAEDDIRRVLIVVEEPNY
ncbi:MAG: hypothetical protein FWE77_00655 [Clostridia bacterium]|nr:hypothetical protein [Clostridia bacterium]